MQLTTSRANIWKDYHLILGFRFKGYLHGLINPLDIDSTGVKHNPLGADVRLKISH